MTTDFNRIQGEPSLDCCEKHSLSILRNTKEIVLGNGGNPSTELRVECYAMLDSRQIEMTSKSQTICFSKEEETDQTSVGCAGLAQGLRDGILHSLEVVMYDATGVRLHAGRQAELLNQIVCELPPEHPLSNVRPLRDSLGHTPFQIKSHEALIPIVESDRTP
ncbi:acid phosphatase/vanadium-dependent haloperoxidase-related protein [Tanacetum coccineum]